ncbi:MFS general substrate transporter [Xylariaceae sp. FL0255]|nr:MFS general substrate transporter [Xylariaceae sp. FL0255]
MDDQNQPRIFPPAPSGLDHFLSPLKFNLSKAAHALAHALNVTFRRLAAESSSQFLPTPITESMLYHVKGRKEERGGTNLRVGFVDLLGDEGIDRQDGSTAPKIRRVLERNWPIMENLKTENADLLFAWIGNCIAEVVKQGVNILGLDPKTEVPMGVTFSFPIVQNSLSDALITDMGKGFSMTTKIDLGTHIVNGYEKSKSSELPRIKIFAILNDAVASFVSFKYQFQETKTHKAVMSIICGTGTNSTIFMRQSMLGEKLPATMKAAATDPAEDIRIAVNTEWSINGSAKPLQTLGFVNRWDAELDSHGEIKGFQPFEYMTSGRYLGELARIIFNEYLTLHLGVSEESIPSRMANRFGLSTTFLSNYYPLDPPTLIQKLEGEFPPSTCNMPVEWKAESAIALYYIAKYIEVRASALMAAAVIGLLACADEIPMFGTSQEQTNLSPRNQNGNKARKDGGGDSKTMTLVVGYTGGCIVHFHNYLQDCQWFLDSILYHEFGTNNGPIKVTLHPCHDGGIDGAGVLCGPDSDTEADERTALLSQNSTRKPSKLGDGDGERAPLLVPSFPGLLDSTTIPKNSSSLTLVSPTPIPDNIDDDDDVTSGDPEANGEAENSGRANHHVQEQQQQQQPPQKYEWLIDTSPTQFHLAFAGIMLTYFIANFDTTIMASSHPVITSHFGASNSASWLTTAFLLTSTAVQPIAGRLSDTVGRKPPYLLLILVFAGGNVWCALATSMASFIAARALCGLGAGGMMTLGTISISDMVPIQRRGLYQSYINIVYGVAGSSGAAFGGMLADSIGWRWEFGVQVFPLAACAIIAALTIPFDLGLQRNSDRDSLLQAMRKFDFLGSGLLTSSTTFLILGLNLGGNVLPWSHPFIIVSLVMFGICFPTCLYVESQAKRPIMPLVLLHSAPRANIIFANFLASFLLNAILFNVPLFFRAVLLTSATTSGLYLVVPTIVASGTGTLVGFLVTWFGRVKWPLVLGAFAYLTGTILLSLMSPGWPTWAYLLCLVPAAAGQGFSFPGTVLAILNASPQEEQAVVTSTVSLWRALGNVLGVACSSLVFQNALLRYLWDFVTSDKGETWKREFIEHVRSSVEAIAQLPDGPHKDQVIKSYEAACRVTFLVCVGIACISVILLVPIRLERIKKR